MNWKENETKSRRNIESLWETKMSSYIDNEDDQEKPLSTEIKLYY